MAARCRFTKDKPPQFAPPSVSLAWSCAAKKTRLSGQRSARQEVQSRTDWKDEGARIAKNANDASSAYIENSLPRLKLKLDPASSGNDEFVTQSVKGESALRQDAVFLAGDVDVVEKAKRKREANLKAAERAFQREAKCWALERDTLRHDLKLENSVVETAESEALCANVDNETRLESSKALAIHLARQAEELPKRTEAARSARLRAEEERTKQLQAFCDGKVARETEQTQLQDSLADLENRIKAAELTEVTADQEFTGRISVMDTQRSCRNILSDQKVSLAHIAAHRRKALLQLQQQKHAYDAAVREGRKATEEQQGVETSVSRLEASLEITRRRLSAQKEDARSQCSSTPAGSRCVTPGNTGGISTSQSRSVTPGLVRTPSPNDFQSISTSVPLIASVDDDDQEAKERLMYAIRDNDIFSAAASNTSGRECENSISENHTSSNNESNEQTPKEFEMRQRNGEPQSSAHKEGTLSPIPTPSTKVGSDSINSKMQSNVEYACLPDSIDAEFPRTPRSSLERCDDDTKVPVLKDDEIVRKSRTNEHNVSVIEQDIASSSSTQVFKATSHDLEKNIAGVTQIASNRSLPPEAEAKKRSSRRVGKNKKQSNRQVQAEPMDAVIRSMADTLSALSEWRKTSVMITKPPVQAVKSRQELSCQEASSHDEPINSLPPAREDDVTYKQLAVCDLQTACRVLDVAPAFALLPVVEFNGAVTDGAIEVRAWQRDLERTRRANKQEAEMKCKLAQLRQWFSTSDTHVRQSAVASNFSLATKGDDFLRRRWIGRLETQTRKWLATREEIERCHSRFAFSLEGWSDLHIATEVVRDFLEAMHSLSPLNRSSVSASYASSRNSRCQSRLGRGSPEMERTASLASPDIDRNAWVVSPDMDSKSEASSFFAFAEEFLHTIASLSQSSGSIRRSTPDLSQSEIQLAPNARRGGQVTKATRSDESETFTDSFGALVGFANDVIEVSIFDGVESDSCARSLERRSSSSSDVGNAPSLSEVGASSSVSGNTMESMLQNTMESMQADLDRTARSLASPAAATEIGQ